jgi:hypothetical protein
MAAVSAVLGLLAALAILCLAPTPAIKVDGAQMHLRDGTGRSVGAALEVSSPNPAGQLMATAALPDVPAYRYDSVTFRVSGLDGATSPAVFWISRANPKAAHARPLSPEEVRAGRAALASDDRWRGDMMTFGLVAQGPLREPLRIDELQLQPGQIAWDATLAALWRNWTHVENWGGGSVNFHVGGLRNERRLTPVLFVALWGACALISFLLVRKLFLGRGGESSWATPLLVVLLAGGALLDARWQVDLLERARMTLAGGGQPPDKAEKLALEEMRARITDPQARLIVVTQDAVSYQTHRARYHLLPVRTSYGVERLPAAAQVRPGDYLLLLSYRDTIRYEAIAGVLATPETTLRVELLARSPAAGALFRILGGS